MNRDHAEQARIHLQHARNSSDAECDELAHVAYAQVHATLALAAEQRAANIIAAYHHASSDEDADTAYKWIFDFLTAAIQPVTDDAPGPRTTDPLGEDDAEVREEQELP